jgi:hypothetical protein
VAPLTADLIAAPGSDGALTLPLAGTPAQPAELLTINERHGSMRRTAGGRCRTGWRCAPRGAT